MIKLFERIFWHNNTTPAINEDNLNAMSKAIDDIDNRVIELGADVMEVVPQIQAYLDQAADLVEAMELLTKNPPYIGANGNWYVWDTDTSSFVDSGIDASITVQIADVTMLAYGTAPYITNSGTSTDPVFHLFIPRAAGITSITKTGTSGLVDTYTVTFQDGNTSTFQVTNGKGIVSIAKTSTSGLVDTYTITFNDSTTTTFTVTNGNGDMNKSTYDPQSAVENAGGISNYVSGAVSSLESAFANNVNQNGCKNILDFPYTDSWTHKAHQITFSTNTNGSVTASGTNTDGSRAFCALVMGKTLKAGKYVISKGTTDSHSQMRVRNSVSVSTIYAEISSSTEHAEFTLLEDTVVDIEIMTSTNAVVSNLVFYPMLCFASDYAVNPEWQSPTKTNHQLTQDSVTWDDLSKVGAVNYAPNKLTSASGTNYSYSVDSDGVITVVVTNTLPAAERVNINSALSLKKGTYKLSGCADNGSVNTYRLQIYTSDNISVALDYGKNGTPYSGDKGDTFTLSSDTTGLILALRLGSGLTAGTYKFYPMVTSPDYNGPYVPYAKTNKELTNELTIGTVSATRNTDYLNGTNAVTFRKYGKMVSCEGYFQVTTAAARNEVLYTLAELPLASSFILAFKNTSEYGLLNVKPNGTVDVESNDGLPIGFYSLIGTFVLA